MDSSDPMGFWLVSDNTGTTPSAFSAFGTRCFDSSISSSTNGSTTMADYRLYPTYFDDGNIPYPILMSPGYTVEAMDEQEVLSHRRRGSSSLYLDKSALSNKRRAQNRAAQRAFRERKERRAKDLEEKLSGMTDKYKSLEAEHQELQLAYDKLRQMMELLTSDGVGDKSGERLCKLFEIIHGKARRRYSISEIREHTS